MNVSTLVILHNPHYSFLKRDHPISSCYISTRQLYPPFLASVLVKYGDVKQT